MTQRDAVDVAALDLRDRLFPVPTKSSDWAITDARRADALDAIADALRSVSNSRAEAMRSGLDIGAAEMELSRVLSEYDYEMPADGMRRVIEAALPLPAPGAPASPWRGMESAPKTGERILATGGGLGRQVEVVTWNERIGCWNAETCTLDDHNSDPDGYNRPTLWADLPTPPASKDT